jgi:uncharacterized protein with PhoU and TrkA domain
MRAPRTVKDLLVDAKDAAELMVDLAYAAVFFEDDSLAREVLRLEARVDQLLVDLRTTCMLAARTPDDAEQLAGVLSLAVSIEGIADSAEDIARVVLSEVGVPRELREDLRHATEVTARVRIRPENELDGRSLAELELPSHSGMWVIAIRRDVDWIFGPQGSEVLHENDVLFLQGPKDGVDAAHALAGSSAREYRDPPEAADGRAALSHLDRAVDLVVELKDASEVAVGLAYSAILLRDVSLAAEGLRHREASRMTCSTSSKSWVLRAACEIDEPNELRGLLHLAAASERIVDAAQSMCRLIEDGLPPHPIIAHCAYPKPTRSSPKRSSTRTARSTGAASASLRLHTELGMEMLAIQRHRRWFYRPRATRVHALAGDRLLALGPYEGAQRLRTWSGDDGPLATRAGSNPTSPTTTPTTSENTPGTRFTGRARTPVKVALEPPKPCRCSTDRDARGPSRPSPRSTPARPTPGHSNGRCCQVSSTGTRYTGVPSGKRQRQT